MFSERFINEISTTYINELKLIGRQFNPIKVRIKTRKSISNFGKAKHTFEIVGYDEIEINQYIVDEDELRNTILHELAHLDLYARGNKHGSRWQHVASIYGKKYNMSLSRVSNKEIKVPGQVIVRVKWSEKCLKANPGLRNIDSFERKYSSIGYANNFVIKYKNVGYIEDFEIIRS